MTTLKTIARGLPGLKYLHIIPKHRQVDDEDDPVPYLYDEAIEEIVKHCPVLEEIRLSMENSFDVPRMTDCGVSALSKSPCLRHIELNEVGLSGDGFIDTLRYMSIDELVKKRKVQMWVFDCVTTVAVGMIKYLVVASPSFLSKVEYHAELSAYVHELESVPFERLDSVADVDENLELITQKDLDDILNTVRTSPNSTYITNLIIKGSLHTTMSGSRGIYLKSIKLQINGKVSCDSQERIQVVIDTNDFTNVLSRTLLGMSGYDLGEISMSESVSGGE